MEVRDGINISDKLGINPEQMDLVARKLIIPRGTFTFIFFYVGELYEVNPKRGAYIMELHSEAFLNPEFDTHVLWHLNPRQTSQVPSPPNYARCINTMYPGDGVSNQYSCSFEPDSGGYLVCWVTI